MVVQSVESTPPLPTIVAEELTIAGGEEETNAAGLTCVAVADEIVAVFP